MRYFAPSLNHLGVPNRVSPLASSGPLETEKHVMVYVPCRKPPAPKQRVEHIGVIAAAACGRTHVLIRREILSDPRDRAREMLVGRAFSDIASSLAWRLS